MAVNLCIYNSVSIPVSLRAASLLLVMMRDGYWICKWDCKTDMGAPAQTGFSVHWDFSLGFLFGANFTNWTLV